MVAYGFKAVYQSGLTKAPAEGICYKIQYSLCPTFMIIFIDLVLHTPPSWLSMPSMVPLDVATREEEGNKQKRG